MRTATRLSTGTPNTYDFENRMLTHGNVSIVYDGDGNRVAETVAGVTTKYLVDTQNPTGYAQVVDELQNGAVTRTYSYGLERISETQSSGTSFYDYDGHGSVRQLTNAAGTVTDSYDYDAFGNLINSTGSTPNNYLFAGEQFDPALGLYYNRTRYLNTTTGRFWTIDTYEGDPESPISLHGYLYASANPVNHIDPSGNKSIQEEEEAEADQTILGTTAVLGVASLIGSLLIRHDFLLENATDPSQVPLALASAIQSRVISPTVKDQLRRRFPNYVFFVHGTSEAAAADINAFGVKEDKILSGGRGSDIPGAFYTFQLLPEPAKAVQLAIEFSLRKPSPHALLVGGLPAGVFTALLAARQAKVKELTGADYDETYFLPPSSGLG